MKKIILNLLFALFTTLGYSQVPNYVPANGLVGWWPFNGNANDESGNVNNGTNNGATLTTDRFGNANAAYSFYGTNDYIEIATNNGSFDSQTYTISFWYKTNTVPYTGFYPRAIISRSNSSGYPSNVYDNYCIFEGGGTLSLNYQGIGTQSNTPSGIDWDTQVNNDSWHLLNITVNSDSLKAYVDGAIVNTQLFIAGIAFQNYSLRIGISNHTFWSEYNGYIDDIGYWNRALTDCEIKDLYNSQLGSNNSSSIQSQTALDTYTWPLNNQTYTQGGTYTATIPNAAGCDSVVTLNLTLNYTGINEPNSNSVSISPNPTTSKITIKASLALVGKEFTIYDQLGKEVKSGVITTEETEIDLSNISEGIYLFKAGEVMQETFKIIKQ